MAFGRRKQEREQERETTAEIARYVTATEPGLYNRMFVAKLNAGRLPVIDHHSIMCKKGEIVHAEIPAQLAKEVVDRKWQGASQGISFRVAKGVRYRTGSMRGHSVQVGSHLEVDDTGPLTITSQRVVFQGSRRTVECAYGHIVGMLLYTDAIQISVSNRQSPSLFGSTARNA